MTAKQFESWARDQMASAEGARNVASYYESTMSNLRYSNREQRSENEKLRTEFKNMRVAVRETARSQTELAQKQQEIDDMALEIRRREFTQMSANLIREVGSALKTGGTELARNMQSGASGIQMAGGLMTSTFGLVTSAGSKLGDGLQRVGTAMMLIPKPLTVAIGAIMTGVGYFASKASAATKALGEVALPLLQAEVEKSNTVFMMMSNSGALFANGIEDMRKAAHDAKLTVSALAAVVKTKTAELASLGLGVTGGVNALGKVLALGGEDFKVRLYKLGFTFEEQAALVADVMADMRQAGEARLIPTEVLRNVNQYAENVRVLSAITGEDIKKRRDEARSAAAQLAFQSKLVGMDENVRKDVVDAMEAMDAQQQKNFMEMVVFGTVINREGAILQSLIPAYREATQEQLGLFNRQQLNLRTQTELQSRMGPGITQGSLGLGSTIGVAGMANVGGIVGSLSTMIGGMLQFFKKFTPKAFAEATGGVFGQAVAEGQTGDLAKIQVEGNNLAIAFEKAIGPLLSKYLTVLEFLMDKVNTIAAFIGRQLNDYFYGNVSASTITPEQALQMRRELGATGVNDRINNLVGQQQRVQGLVRDTQSGLETLRDALDWAKDRDIRQLQNQIRNQEGLLDLRMREERNLRQNIETLRGTVSTPTSQLTNPATTLAATDALADRLVAQIKQQTAEKLDTEEGTVLSYDSVTIAELGRAIADGLRPMFNELTQATLGHNDLLADGNRIATNTYRMMS
jgi:hypothetical protein